MFPVFYIFYVTVVILLQLKCCTKILSNIECCCDRENNETSHDRRMTELTDSLLGDSSNTSLSRASHSESDAVPEPKRKRKNTMSEFFNFEEEGNFMREIVNQKRYHFGIPRTAQLLRPGRTQSVTMDPVALSKALGDASGETSARGATAGLASDLAQSSATKVQKSKRAKSFSAGGLSSHTKLLELADVPTGDDRIRRLKTDVTRRNNDKRMDGSVVDDDAPEELDPLDMPNVTAEPSEDAEEQQEEEEGEERIEPRDFRHHLQIMRTGFGVKWKAMKPGAKVFYVLSYPLVVVRRLTIPTVTADSWSREETALSIAFAPPFFFWATGHADLSVANVVPVWAIALVFGFGFAVPAYWFTKWSHPPKWNIVLIIVAFVMSVVWIMFIASELVTVLAGLGMILTIPATILGLTVLAWGNSLGDMVANVSVAKAGKPKMAIAGCYAGPMFNMLIGQGLSLVLVTTKDFFKTGKGNFELNSRGSHDWITPFCFYSAVAGLVIGMISVAMSKFTFTKITAGLLLALYAIFMIICVLGETHVNGHSILGVLSILELESPGCGES